MTTPKCGKKTERDQKATKGDGQCESGDKPRVWAGRKGNHPRVRSYGVWKAELSVCGKQSQGENLGMEH